MTKNIKLLLLGGLLSVLTGILIGFLTINNTGIPIMVVSILVGASLMFGYSHKIKLVNIVNLVGVIVVTGAWAVFLLFG